jgi:hypothetical protein
MPVWSLIALLLLPAWCVAQPPANPPPTQSDAPPDASDPGEARFGTTVVISSGLQGQIFFISKFAKKLPNLDKKKAVGTIYTTGLNISHRQFTEGFPGVTNRFEWFAIDYNGRFYIANPGNYRFALESDDGSLLYIDGKEVIDNDGLHTALRKEAAVDLAGGIHTLRLSYFQGPRYELSLILSIAGPGDAKFRIFNTNEFKPPNNPEDWKFGNPDDLKNLPDLDPRDKNGKKKKKS